MVTDSLLSVAPVATGEILVLADEGMRKQVLHHVSMLGLSSAQAESAARAIDIAQEKSETLDCIVLDSARRRGLARVDHHMANYHTWRLRGGRVIGHGYRAGVDVVRSAR